MSSIPLPALGVKPPEPGPNAIQQYGQLLSLKNLQQQGQMGQVQLQQAQQAQQDQQTVRKAFMDSNGDLDQAIKLSAQRGVSPAMLTQLQQHAVDVKTKLSTLQSDQLKNLATQNDNARGLIQPIVSAPPEKQAEMYAVARQTALQNPQAYGITDPSQIPEQFPGADALKTQVALHMGGKQQAEDAIKERETQAKELDAKARATSANTASQRLTAEMPGGSMQPVDQKELSDYLQKNPGKGPMDFAAAKAKLAPMAQMVVANSQSGGLNSPALDNAAEKYWSTGSLPRGGRGPAVMAQNQKIMNRAAELHQGESIMAGTAAYKANADSLKKIQSNFDNVSAFENTAVKNLDQVAQAGAAIPELGSRFANVPVRMISSQMLGTPEMARFKTALLTAQTESAKILGSSNASGVLSDSARHEAQEVLEGNLPFPAMMASINQLKTDFANRHQSYQQQIQDIQGRIKGTPQQNQPSAGGFNWNAHPVAK